MTDEEARRDVPFHALALYDECRSSGMSIEETQRLIETLSRAAAAYVAALVGRPGAFWNIYSA